MNNLTPAQLTALRRIRTASGVRRHYVTGCTLDIPGWMWAALTAKGALERRTEADTGRYEYRLTEAGHDAALEATRAD